MSDNDFPPMVFVHRANDGSTVPIPDSFFDGVWSLTAVAMYFHILTDEDGVSEQTLYGRHPYVARQEIDRALRALLGGGYIERCEVYRDEGYAATNVRHEDPQGGEQA